MSGRRDTERRAARLRAARLLAVIGLVLLNLAPAVAFAFPERIQPPQAPAGWERNLQPSDRPEYVGYRFQALNVGNENGTANGTVDAIHYWWFKWSETNDDFLTTWAPRKGEEDRGWVTNGEEFTNDWGPVTLDGQQFGRYTARTVTPGISSSTVEDSTIYYVALPDGSSIEITVYVYGEGEAAERVRREADAIVNGLRFDFTEMGSAAASTGEQPPATTEPPAPSSTVPWKTVTSGAAALAAAAAAIAGTAAASRGRKTKLDPNEVVGYVLELSTLRLTVASAHSAELTARVWRVAASGAFEPEPAAQVSLSAPRGVAVQPASGSSPLSAVVWQDGDLAPGAGLVVRASAPKGGTQSRVEVVGEDASELVLSVVPAGARLKPTGRDAVMVKAVLKPSLRSQASPDVDLEAARASITFAQPTSAEWLDIGEPRDIPHGKEMPVSLSSPDPNRQLTPPDTVTVSATTALGTEQLRGSVTVPVEKPPSVDARPDAVEYSAGSGETVDVVAWVEDPGELEWTFAARWKEGDRPLATFSLEPKSASSTVLTLTENAAKLPDSGTPEEVSTLIVTASGEGWDDLERHIKVEVTREGLFVDRIGRGADGAYSVDATGKATPTEIDVRVYARDASGAIALDEELSAAVEWTPAGEESSPGRTALGFAEFAWKFTGVRPSNAPSATFEFTMARRMPTAGEPVPATLRASVPGSDDAKMSALVSVKFVGVDTSPYSDAWKVEYENCMHVINEFAPRDLQARLRDLVNDKGRLMGAEGLFEMRRRIWSISSNALMKEHADWMDKAWTYEQIESVLDWVSWCGDIAFAVASGRITGTAAAIALGALKPMLVSAVTVYANGGDIGDWASQQVSFIISVAEGQLTDPDFIQKLTGSHKATVWGAFICYTFIKNWAMDPEHSITRAMTQTAQMLRDQALISFLRMVAGTGPGAAPKPGTATATPAGTPKPGSAKGGAPAGPAKPGAAKPGPASSAKGPGVSTKPGAASAPGGAKPDAGPSTAGGGPKPPRKPPAPGSVVRPGEGAKKQQVRGKPMKPAPEFDAPDPKTRAAKMAEAVKAKTTTGPDGKPKVDADTMEKIMRDPDGARELRKNDPEGWKAYDNARKEAYGQHDGQLKDWISENVPEAKGQRVEVRSVGTSDGVDRDYRAGIVKKDPVTGKEVFVEIPKEKWAPKSQEIFAEVTGGPKDPAKAAEWSKAHQQLATDGYHAEASVDMADQAWVKNPKTGEWEQTQMTSNLVLTEQGKSTLMDPDGLGKTYETKVAESYHEGGPLDGYTQANKAVHTLTEVRTGYKAQDYQLKAVPPKVLDGMQIIQQVAEGRISPADGDAALEAAGCGNNLPDFMEKMSGQFASLKFAHK